MISPGYNAYLQSPEWAAIRKAKLNQCEHRCQECCYEERLEVHHLTYERLGKERLEDLMVLCHFCHAREHGRPVTGVGPIAGRSIPEITEADRDLKMAQERAVGLVRWEMLESEADELWRVCELPQTARKRIKSIIFQSRALRREAARARSLPKRTPRQLDQRW